MNSKRIIHLVATFVLLLPVVPAGALAAELHLAWAPSNDEATVGYDVEVLDAFDQVIDVIDVGAATRATIDGLDDNVRYRFRIRPYDIQGTRAREASSAIETFPAPRLDALEGIPAPGRQASVTLTGANFDPAARVVSRRTAVRVAEIRVESPERARVTLSWDGTGTPPGVADLTVVNPVRKAEPYFETHPEVLDVDASGTIDGVDLNHVHAAFGVRRGEPGWDARLDVNGDGVIGGEDEAPIRAHLGRPASAGAPTSRRQERADRL